MKQVLDYMKALNDTAVDIGGRLRKENKLFDFSCFREAWLNACLHNRWSRQTPPAECLWCAENIRYFKKGVVDAVSEIKKSKHNEPADIVIYVKDRGIVLREKSLIAIDKEKCKTVAVGNEAEWLDQEPESPIVVISPLRQGMITDFTVAKEMFKVFFQKAQIKIKGFQRPKRIAVSVPKGISEVELKTYDDLFCVIFNINIPLSLYRGDLSLYVPPVCFTDIEMNEFIETSAEKYTVIIGITKENPAAYVREQLKHTLEYAKEAGIDREDVIQML